MVKHRRILGKNAKFDSYGSSSLSLKTKNRTVFGMISFYWASDTFYWCLYSFLSLPSTNCVDSDRFVLFGFPPFRSCCVRNWRSSCRTWTVLWRKKSGQRGGKYTQHDRLPEETQNYVNFDPLRCLCRRERLVYVGISVENIIPVSKSQRAWESVTSAIIFPLYHISVNARLHNVSV